MYVLFIVMFVAIQNGDTLQVTSASVNTTTFTDNHACAKALKTFEANVPQGFPVTSIAYCVPQG